jgi:glycosyltransferase involved in cell wall biosynthesis
MLVRAYPTKENPVSGIFTKELVHALEDQGATIHVYQLKGFSLFNFVKYKRILKKKKIDLIHAQFGFPAGFWGAFFTKKLPLIITIHRSEIVDKKMRKFFPLLRYGLRKADKVIAVSEFISDEIFKLDSCFKEKTIVLHNGVDIKKFHMRKTENVKEEIAIGTIGNHIPRKGIDLLIQAYSIVEKQNMKANLLIAGSGPESLNLKSLSKSLNISNVKFLGRIPESKKNDFYQKLDVFVLSSYSEGHPITLLEAMSTGCCVLVSDIPSISTTIQDNNNGLIFKTGDYDDLSEKLLTIIDNHKHLKKLGREANQSIKDRFDLRKRSIALMQIYEEVIVKED